jgi:hypothetical protein
MLEVIVALSLDELPIGIDPRAFSAFFGEGRV